MNTRSFLLLERLQKLDALLNLAQSRPGDPVEIARLRARKRTLRDRLARLMQRSLTSAA